MFLCSQHPHSLGFLRRNIVTVDSGVAILSLYYQSIVGAHLSLEYGTSKKTVIFDIAANTVDKDFRDILPGLHALTGCDSTSCFFGQIHWCSKTFGREPRTITNCKRGPRGIHLLPIWCGGRVPNWQWLVQALLQVGESTRPTKVCLHYFLINFLDILNFCWCTGGLDKMWRS